LRIAVMGSGGIGSCYGGMLAQAGSDVTLIARGAHLQAIQQNGLEVMQREDSFKVNVPATDDPSQVGPVDLVLFTVKTYQNQEAIPLLKPLIGGDSLVLTLQNGVESAGEIADVIGADHVLPGAAYMIGNIISPGVVRQGTFPARIAFGESAGPRTPRAEAVQETLTKGGITTELSDDVIKVLWSKVLYNTPANGLASVARIAPRDLMDMPQGAELFKMAIAEVAAVANASGVEIGDDDVQTAISLIANRPLGARGSMQIDLADGKPLELEAIVGCVGRIGRNLGVPTPIHDLVNTMLLPHISGPPEAPCA